VPPVATESRPATAPTPAATTPVEAPPAVPVAAQPPPAEPSPPAASPETPPAPTPAPAEPTGLLDAAEAQAEADALDPAKAPTVVDPLSESIRLGRGDLAAQRLIAPPGRNALERFQFALNLEPRSKQARQGIVDVAKKFVELADKAAAADKSGTVSTVMVEQLAHAADAAKLVPEGAEVMKEISARRRRAAEPLIAQAKAAAERWDKVAAKAAYEQALKVDPDDAAARDGLKFVATIGEPGFVFRDRAGESGSAPAMVVLSGAGLAMARHPVTRAEFRRFWDSGGRSEFSGKEPSCRDRESIFRSSKKRSWENPDIAQDDSHPVVCISWAEATAYAQWLSKQTGKRYRLPSPAEFDRVAARAGRGDCKSANLADASYNKQFDSRDGGDCDDGFAATSPVERFGAVEGVFDIDGNVREWVAACGNGAPAAAGSNCRDFSVKGRGWLSAAGKESATFKDNYAGDVSLNSVGFRVVRDLTN
jgi:formylglycine-generating enzyme required for sulfatase activity